MNVLYPGYLQDVRLWFAESFNAVLNIRWNCFHHTDEKSPLMLMPQHHGLIFWSKLKDFWASDLRHSLNFYILLIVKAY